MGQLYLAFIERWLQCIIEIRRLQCFSAIVPWPREAGCFRDVAALYSDHLRQFPLYVTCQVRKAEGGKVFTKLHTEILMSRMLMHVWVMLTNDATCVTKEDKGVIVLPVKHSIF